LPGWQALHTEIEPLGATVVTVALDVNIEHARPWHDRAACTHPSVVDTTHATNAAFGFLNIPMAVWIDEDGNLVRPAESASIERSPLRDMEIPDGLPERLRLMYQSVKDIPDDGEAYRAAIVDWVTKGADSVFALQPHEVIERSQPRSTDEAKAAACFDLGNYLRTEIGPDAAVQWWKEAHRLHPKNLTYKRQAWTLVTTPEGAAENDLMQGPNDVYETNLLDEVLDSGGFRAFIVRPQL